MELQLPACVNHFTVAVLDERGEKVRGYDYRHWAEAEGKRHELATRGRRAVVWAADAFGQKIDG